MNGAILLARSEGLAAVIGTDPETALASGLGVGGLLDALSFRGRENVAVDRVARQSQRAVWGLPALPVDPGAMEEINSVLGLPMPVDLSATLQRAARTTPEGIVQDAAGP